MECDSMHSTIERASEFAKIYIPEDWLNVIRLARKDHPYFVQEMNHNDFLDFKEMRATMLPIKMKATDGTILQWNNVRWLQFKEDAPDVLYFKSDYWEDFKEVRLNARMTRSGRTQTEITKLYSEQIFIKQVKHKDLMSMCRDGTIPKKYHYYEKLPVLSTSISTADNDNDDELTLATTRDS